MRVADQRRRRGQGRARASTPPGPPAGGGGRKSARRPADRERKPRGEKLSAQKKIPQKLPKSGTVRALSWIKPKTIKSQNATRIKRTLRRDKRRRKEMGRARKRRGAFVAGFKRDAMRPFGAQPAPRRDPPDSDKPPKNKAGKQKRPFGPIADDFSIKSGRMRQRVVCSLKKLQPRARRAACAEPSGFRPRAAQLAANPKIGMGRRRNATLGKNHLKGKTA